MERHRDIYREKLQVDRGRDRSDVFTSMSRCTSPVQLSRSVMSDSLHQQPPKIRRIELKRFSETSEGTNFW